MEQDRVTGLVICRNLLLLLGDDLALLLRADSNLDKRLIDVRLADKLPVVAGCINRRLVHQILQIGTGKSCRGLSHAF